MHGNRVKVPKMLQILNERKMQPHKFEQEKNHDLFKSRLENIINIKHGLVLLAHKIDWARLEKSFGKHYKDIGRPGVPMRLMMGLQLLRQMYNLSDEGACDRWVCDPYFQYFCGETYFQHEFPIERSSMTHWRKRMGEERAIELLQESLSVAYQVGALEIKDVKQVIVDTTVQEKAITFPTDGKLQLKAIQELGKLALTEGIKLRQSYKRIAKKVARKIGNYRHAKQFKRALKAQKKLRGLLGRVIRDIERKLAISTKEISSVGQEVILKAKRIFKQKRTDKNKLYSWHAPEVECIGKGKASKPYEFGCKASIISTLNPSKAGHLLLQAEALHNNPFDGHTLKGAIDNLVKLTGISPDEIFVDRGYRGHDKSLKFKVFKSGQKRIPISLKKAINRRSAIEPVIGHFKNETRFGRNYLKGAMGDKINPLFAAAGYNFKRLLSYFREFLYQFLLEQFLSFCKKNKLYFFVHF